MHVNIIVRSYLTATKIFFFISIVDFRSKACKEINTVVETIVSRVKNVSTKKTKENRITDH